MWVVSRRLPQGFFTKTQKSHGGVCRCDGGGRGGRGGGGGLGA